MDPLWRQIQEAIHQRDTKSVYRLIPRFLKAQCSSPEALYEASEFYRKITDYKSALRVLPKERSGTAMPPIPDIETKLELQLARLLNILGASNYALRMVDRLRVEYRAKSKVEAAEIYHCNYRYADVLELIGVDFPLPESEPWHRDWILHFYHANAQSGLKRPQPAIDRVDRIHALSASPLIQAIARCYKGKFLTLAGKPEEALPYLLEALRFFRDDDQTADHAIVQINLGNCFFNLGKFSEAKRALEKALKAFHQPGFKPEDWLEIRLLLERIPGYAKSGTGLAPRWWALEGPEYPPLKRLGLEDAGKLGDLFSVSRLEKSRKAKHFDRASDMAWDGRTVRLGLDLVDALIWNLVYAGEDGLPQYRLYELLWPNEPFSFDQHQKRLERLVGRARSRGYEIVWESLHLRLSSKDVTASGRPEKVVRGRYFLLEHPTFSRRDIERYFSMPTTTAKDLCREWVKDGLVAAMNKHQYRVVIS